MKMSVWVALGLAGLTGTAAAGELRCGADGPTVSGVEGSWLWVASDGRLHRLEKDGPKDAPDSVEVFCEGRLGLVAIVLPAPRPGPDDGVPGHRAEGSVSHWKPVIQERPGLALDPFEEVEEGGEAGEGKAPPSAGEAKGAEGSAAEPAPTLARPSSTGTLDPLAEAYAEGCQAAPGPGSHGFGWLAALFLGLGLRRWGRR